MSELRKRAENLSDRTVGVIVLSLTLVCWVGLVTLFSSLLGSFLAGATLLMVLATAANFIVRARIH